MKIIKYLTAALIALFAWSCADEGPETMGSLDIKYSVNVIKSRSAQITLTRPETYDPLICKIGECWLEGPEEDGFIYDSGIEDESESETAIVKKFTFTDLTPSTTYKIIVRAYGSLNGANDYTGIVMEIGTLTTLSDKEAYTTDYLLVSDDCVVFNLSIDYDFSKFREIENIYISEYPDMTNAQQIYARYPEGIYNNDLRTASVCPSDNENPTATITIKGLRPDTKYYYVAEIGNYYNSITVTPGNNSFTTTHQPAGVLKSIGIFPSLRMKYSNNYIFTCIFGFGDLNVKGGYLYLNGGVTEEIIFYGNKGISKDLYISDTIPLCYSLGMIVDFVKDGVTYTANGITYTPEDNVIQIPEAK